LRDTVRAISSIQTAIEQDPEFLDAYNSLSALYVGQKNFKAGMQALKSAFLLSPYDELLNLNIAIVYRNMAETDSAIRYFQRAIKINPNNKEAGLAIAQALIKQDKPQEALPYIDDYPVVTPFFLQLKIDAYGKLGKPDSVKKYTAVLNAL
jgi:Tfp pilus assembly protein PilF